MIEAIQKEQTRCRELLKEYELVGWAGQFGAAIINKALANADKAIAEGDVVAMVRVLKELKDLE